MTDNLLPDHELLWRAVKWIGEQTMCTEKIIEEASIRFNLSPKDEAFLIRKFLNNE